MSVKDMVYGFRDTGMELNDFLYDGKVKKNIRREHTKEELEEMLEEIRLDCWSYYKDAIEELGWR